MLSLNDGQIKAVKSIIKFLPEKSTRIIEIDKNEPEPEPKPKPEVNLFNDDFYERNIEDFINDDNPLEETLRFSSLPKEPNNKHNFLLLGPGGSGKTTVITNAIDTNKLKVVFCAFTNKATQVLKNISAKHKISFNTEFMTIHKLLALEIKYQNRETEIAFDFVKEKIEGLKMYDVIIFDECSTISKELYEYIQQAWEYIYFKYGHSIKFIFLGDYWQLPPVGENISVVFYNAIKEKWPVSKLSMVMRSGNEKMQLINQRLLKWVEVFKNKIEKPLEKFIYKFPNNLVKKKDNPNMYINQLDVFLQKYIDIWKEDPDVVILTQSRSNCQKTNQAIQDIVDFNAGRDLPDNRMNIKFYAGDRCCIDRPIEVCTIKHKSYRDTPYVTLDQSTGKSLYNGEIFDIVLAEDVKVVTMLNKLNYIENYFDGQLLTVKRINTDGPLYEIIHINESIINAARKKIIGRGRKMFYIQLLTSFIKVFPKLDYGYCLTVYKSQGSEWRNVLINLSSIKYCIAQNDHSLKNKKSLFRTTYTAMSRASHNMYLFWIS